MNAWLGAFSVMCGGFALITGLTIIARLEIDAHKKRRDDKRDAAHFRRFCAACGGRESAFKVIDAAEQTQDAATDLMMARGMRSNEVPLVRYRDKREVKFTPDGSAA